VPTCREAFERRDLLAGRGRDWRYAGTDFLAVEQNRAGPALGETTAELRAGQFKIVSQDIEQRGVAGGLDLAPGSIDVRVAMKTPWGTRCRIQIQFYPKVWNPVMRSPKG